MEHVGIDSISSILDFCLKCVDDDYSFITKADKDIFLHVGKEVTQDLNRFNVKKHKCALCGGSAHNFDSCPEVTQSDFKGVYIHFWLLINKLMAGLRKLYHTSKDYTMIFNPLLFLLSIWLRQSMFPLKVYRNYKLMSSIPTNYLSNSNNPSILWIKLCLDSIILLPLGSIKACNWIQTPQVLLILSNISLLISRIFSRPNTKKIGSTTFTTC